MFRKCSKMLCSTFSPTKCSSENTSFLDQTPSRTLSQINVTKPNYQSFWSYVSDTLTPEPQFSVVSATIGSLVPWRLLSWRRGLDVPRRYPSRKGWGASRKPGGQPNCFGTDPVGAIFMSRKCRGRPRKMHLQIKIFGIFIGSISFSLSLALSISYVHVTVPSTLGFWCITSDVQYHHAS